MVDERIVERWLSRGTRFFRGITRNAEIRGELARRGLDEQELGRGWDLYSLVLGVRNLETLPAAVENKAGAAMAKLDNWDADGFRTSQAVLESRAPRANKYMFNGLSPAKGPEAVVAVETYLNRRDALKSGTAPEVPAEEGKLAVKLLATRLVMDDELATHFRDLIATTRQVRKPPEETAEAAEPDDGDEVFEAFRGWLHEWREVARSTFKRRDYLIQLGLATRRTNDDGEEEVIEDSEPDEGGSEGSEGSETAA